jgi:hypothetical protein
MANFGMVEMAMMTQGLSDTQKALFQTQYQGEKKDPGVCVILALFLFDRFWLGDIGLGILKYITLGGCGIWGLIDLFTASGRCNEYNRQKAAEIIQAIKLMHPN